MKNLKNDLFKGVQENQITKDSMNALIGGAETTAKTDPTPHCTNHMGTDCSSEPSPTTWTDTLPTSSEFDTPQGG